MMWEVTMPPLYVTSASTAEIVSPLELMFLEGGDCVISVLSCPLLKPSKV